jgi:hypothetical protein
MARRWRVGLAANPTARGVLTAAALIAALLVTGRVLNGGPGGGQRPPAGSSLAPTAVASTQAPERTGGTAACPRLWPVLAMSDHRSYPPGHPTRPPPEARPVVCYQTAAAAARGGYDPAPLPPGALRVGGVYLATTGQSFRASCQRAADRLGFTVPCPGLLPTGPRGSPAPRLCDRPLGCRRGQVLRFVHGGFIVPPGYVGAPGGYGALSILAAPTGDASSRRALECGHERRIAAPTAHSTPAVLAVCSDDPQRSALGGSVLLRWSRQGTAVVVSVLDWSDGSRWSDASSWSGVNRRLVVALADHLRLVAPRS